MAKKHVDKYLKFKFGLDKRIAIYEKLMFYTQDGTPIYDSLVRFKLRFDKKKDFRGKIIGIWLETMKKGGTFSQAIDGWVPDAELNLISSGESGTGIATGLEEAIKFSMASKQIKSAIISGSIYPVALLLVVAGFLAMFAIKMAPTYSNILPVERWPDLGLYLYNLSHIVVDGWMYILIILIVLSFVIGSTINKWTGSTRDFFDYIPPWSVYKVYQSSSFLITLSSMMKAGTPLNDSIKRIKLFATPWLTEYLEEMLKNLRKGGKNFGNHLNVGLLDDETAGDVIDYSESGKFEKAVYSIGERNLKETVKKIETKMGLLKNIMLFVVGLTVGWIYYSSIVLNNAVADAATSTISITQKK